MFRLRPKLSGLTFIPMPLVRVVRMTINQVIDVLSSMHHGTVPTVWPVVMVRLTLVNLVQLRRMEHSGIHEAVEFIHSGVRRGGSSRTTLSRC